tara:strand:- start:524 stop:682 length:159 start_codon:yes stop_codon:yes gene_type:complete
MNYAEKGLCKLGCPKINLLIRDGNKRVSLFYRKIGFFEEKRISISKRLEVDQ